MLVVDDDDGSRGELEGAVLDLGHVCMTAREGAEAWELHRAHDFDVIVSDWMMPCMDGLELCRRARADSSDGYTYFIMMTSLTDRPHVVEALRGGVDDYLTKPLDIEQLTAKLQSASRITRLHRGLSRSNASLKRAGDRAFDAARTDPLTQAGNRLRLQDDL
ncbi:MAG: response regulator [Myxococcales bacterium]|nr:response regulator [Myxococcales bacterium]